MSPRETHPRSKAAGGTILCLASAASFGATGIFGRLAYDDGATVGTLLAVRFVLAAGLFWALVVVGGAVAELRTVRRRDAIAGLALGAGIYAAQAGGYFVALERLDPSVLALLVYTFPAIVAVAAIALGRERAHRRRLVALGIVSGGLVLVLASSGVGSGDPVGAALGLATAVMYSVYILVSEGVARRVSPLVLSALVCSGAAVSLTGGSAVLGELRPGELTVSGWGWIACIALVCTGAALSLFFAGLRRVGPTRASILATVEPIVTVALAFVVFGDVLGAAQLLGSVVVLSGVLVLQTPTRTASQGREGFDPPPGDAGHADVDDAVVDRVHDAVLGGMGLVVLHSGHYAKVFKRLLGTSCSLRWRNDGERELVWTVAPSHPIAAGVPQPIVIEAHEMYGEHFDIPAPDELVFISSFAGGEVFRGGCCWTRGRGRIFYFSPGDQDYPVYHHRDVQRVIANAVSWAAPDGRHPRPGAPMSPRGWFD